MGERLALSGARQLSPRPRLKCRWSAVLVRGVSVKERTDGSLNPSGNRAGSEQTPSVLSE